MQRHPAPIKLRLQLENEITPQRIAQAEIDHWKWIADTGLMRDAAEWRERDAAAYAQAARRRFAERKEWARQVPVCSYHPRREARRLIYVARLAAIRAATIRALLADRERIVGRSSVLAGQAPACLP